MTVSFFRAEKGSPNSNAVRVLIPGIVIALVLLVLPGLSMSAWDVFLRDRPWVTSTLAIIDETAPIAKPLISDKTVVRHPVYGDRFVWVEANDGTQLCRASRSDIWDQDRTRVWDWDAFFERRCGVPARPFRVCTSFHVYSPRGNGDLSGPFCSPIAAPVPTKEP